MASIENTYELFKSVPSQKTGAPTLKVHKSSGLIDIVNDFSWTLSPVEARQETPTIELIEWRLEESAIQAAFERYAWTAVNKGRVSATYAGLYPAKKTGFWYHMPYFSANYRTLGNTWEDADALSEIPLANRIPIAGEYAGMHGLESLLKFNHVGVGREIPRGFAAGSTEQLEINFVLNNTVSIHDIRRNWEFIYLFSYQNLLNRKSFILVDPPCIYNVKIEGVKYSPAAYVSNLSIFNFGQIKKTELGGRIQHIPEAWGVKITLQDLIANSQNTMDAMRTGDFTSIEATQHFDSQQILDRLHQNMPGTTPPQPQGPPPSPGPGLGP